MQRLDTHPEMDIISERLDSDYRLPDDTDSVGVTREIKSKKSSIVREGQARLPRQASELSKM